jgi:hypothetical protein
MLSISCPHITHRQEGDGWRWNRMESSRESGGRLARVTQIDASRPELGFICDSLLVNDPTGISLLDSNESP